jgi:type II secretion system protein G
MRDVRERAFTLIELLVSITIVAILVGLVLGVAASASQKQDRARAIADLSRLKSGIEEYRIAYGSYPTSAQANVISHLVGQLWVQPQADGKRPFMTYKTWTNATVAYTITDPWGNGYNYFRRNVVNNWATNNNSLYGYDLWSSGPNTQDASDDIANWKGDF